MQECPDNLFRAVQEGEAIQVSGAFVGHLHIHHLDGTITTMPQILPRLLAFPASHVALPFVPPESKIADLQVVQDFYEEPTTHAALTDDDGSSDYADDEDEGLDDGDQSEDDDRWYTPASSISSPVATFVRDVHASDDEWEVQALVAAADGVEASDAEKVEVDGASGGGGSSLDEGSEEEADSDQGVAESEVEEGSGVGVVSSTVEMDIASDDDEPPVQSDGSWVEVIGVDAAEGVQVDGHVAEDGNTTDAGSSPVRSLGRKRRFDVSTEDEDEATSKPSRKRRSF